jgi:preprotein translocase subunit YajC
MQQYYFLILLALVFVVLIVLPGRQRKKAAAQQQQMQESLKPGTAVMTTAGLHATVVRAGEGTVDLEVAPGVVSTYERRAILQIREPAAGAVGGAGGATAVDGGPTPGTTGPVVDIDTTPDDGPGEGPADRAR